MKDINRTESAEKLNERYFLALANSRGSISSFGLQSFVGTVLALLIFMIAGSYSKYSLLNGLNMSLIVIGSCSLLCFMIAVSKLAYKFQLISSSFII